MHSIFDYSIFGNTVLGYLTALGIFAAGLAGVYAFRRYVLARLRRWADSTQTAIDDYPSQTLFVNRVN